MTIQTFAESHRLKLTKDICNHPVITGRIGDSNIYEYSSNELGVMFITSADKEPRTGLWNKFKAACLGSGMTIRQSGDEEGAFSFNGNDPKQAKAAIKGIKARAKRQRTPEQIAAFLAVTHNARFKAQKPIHTGLDLS